MEKFDYFEIIQQLNYKNIWIKKRIQLEITTEQYIAILKGYQPHWDMRYGVLYDNKDQYFYAYRSGFVGGKYKFDKNGTQVYHCTEIYDNPDRPDCMVIFEIILEACSQNDVELNYDSISAMRIETYRLNGIRIS